MSVIVGYGREKEDHQVVSGGSGGGLFACHTGPVCKKEKERSLKLDVVRYIENLHFTFHIFRTPINKLDGQIARQ